MFRTTAKRHLEAIELAASARQFKDQVRENLENLLRARLQDGETLPDVGLFQELIGRLLDVNGSSVLEIDGRYTNQLVSAASLRAIRNELGAKLRQRVQEARFLLERTVDSGILKATLRDRKISKVKFVPLVQGARDLAATLRDPGLVAGMAGSTLAASAANLAAALETEATELEQVLGQLTPQAREKQHNLGAKVSDLQQAAETTQRCSELLYGLYRVAGLDFHADRLRTKARKKPNQQKGKELPAPPEPPSPSTALVRLV